MSHLAIRKYSLLLFWLCLGFISLADSGFLSSYEKELRTIEDSGQNKSDALHLSGKNNLSGRFLFTDYNVDNKNIIVKLDKKNPFGFTHSFYDFKEEEYFRVSVWRLGGNEDGILVADGIDDNKFYRSQNKPDLIDSAGWQLINLDVHIPPYHHFEELRIYIWNKGTHPIYFRDLKIERYPEKTYPEFDQLSLEINVEEAALNKLKRIRDTAFKNGILEAGKNDYVKARMIYGNDTLKAKIRLKGDWLDHLIGSKWSFRIKMRKDDSWKNMRSFSLQSPETRGFLDEWFAHKIFAAEDVLTTRYGFVPVKLNGKSLGIYAYEEHFDKQLVESNKRREGPILKFSEEMFWTTQRLYLSDAKYYASPIFEASDILPFKENRILNNRVLFDEFLVAQNLLYQFKYGLKPVSEIFNLNSLAKYYALSDIAKGYHGFIWHNFRFYYNPVMSRLEPVAFDCYNSAGVKNGTEDIIFETAKKSRTVSRFDNMILLPFKQKDFSTNYLYCLNKYSNETFLDSIYHSLQDELDSLGGLIKKEFGFYKFNISLYKDNCKKINSFLDSHKNSSEKSGYGVREVKDAVADVELPDDFIPLLIKIFKNNNYGDSTLNLTSLCKGELNVVGYVYNNSSVKYESNYTTIPEKSKNFLIKTEHSDSLKYLLIKVKGRNKLFSIPVFHWTMPFDYAPSQELGERYIFENQSEMVQNEHNLTIEGKLDISEPLIIPAGYLVVIMPGTELNFVNKSSFISYSPVNIRGTATQPVRITSSDGTAMGFNVFQAGGKSILNNVIFDQFNTLDFNGWTLTGAVNFYESDVDLNHVTFKNNRSEDALNIIKSDFTMIDCTFDNIFSDAFDSDFSDGNLTNTNFRDIGNDAIDFSGSKVTIKNCEINNAGDKGISCGEKSEISVDNVRVNKTNIAIASKDLSRLTISNSLLSNSNYSFAAFKKKPEFGEAEIYSVNNTLSRIIKGHIIEKGSVIYINNKLFYGTSNKVSDKFYIK